MADHKISILDSNASNDRLVLSDDNLEVNNILSRPVMWDIADPKVESFKIVAKMPGDPLGKITPKDYSQTAKLHMKLIVPLGDWKYSIYWKDRATHQEHIYDPKIAVKTGLGLDFFKLGCILAGLTVAAFTLSSLKKMKH